MRRRWVASEKLSPRSAGAVKQNATDPLGTQISEPIRELRPLQEAMRARREQAEVNALTGVPAAALSPEEEAAMQEQAGRAAEEEFQQVEPAGEEPGSVAEPSQEPPPEAAPVEGEEAVEEPAENEPAAAEASDEAPAPEATPR